MLFITLTIKCKVEKKAPFRYLLLFDSDRGGNNKKKCQSYPQDLRCVQRCYGKKDNSLALFFSQIPKTLISTLMAKNRPGRIVILEKDCLKELFHKKSKLIQKTPVNHLQSMESLRTAHVLHSL